ncbi:CRISPR-associated helicase Cas3' [Candidatus Poribacteria bacterium]|nr:CRISPR-associated helicase Cas3' [Candidatus Poribacteria bacterium]
MGTHLGNVCEIGEIFSGVFPVYEHLTPDSIPFLLNTVCACHDLGKATDYFQNYLDGKAKKSKESSHALFSALIAYFYTQEMLRKNSISGDIYRIFPIIAYEAIKRHHSDLREIREELIFDEEETNLIRSQLEALPQKEFDELASEIGLDITKSWFLEKLPEATSEISAAKRWVRKNVKGTDSVDFYFLQNYVFSILIDSDKTEVSQATIEEIKLRPELPDNCVEVYKSQQNWKKNNINELRERAYQETVSNDVATSDRIFSLNLPTGMGKTLTALSFALKLKSEIERKSGVTPRIIYCLPFLSIIDQNYKVIRSVFEYSIDTVSSAHLMQHHHLSDIYYQTSEGTEYEISSSDILIGGWNSEIVATTFVQFFHSIFSNKNRMLRKFNKLANSIVIMDELQAIPHKYWPILGEVFSHLADHFNTRFILCSATIPNIKFPENRKAKELVDGEKYILDRVHFHLDINEKKTIEEFAREAYEQITQNDNKSYLFIFNTISSAKQFYYLLNGMVTENIAFLSSHIIPKHRLAIIERIRNKEYRIAVTTQIVEAGVDIDFDVVYRDLAPMDSLAQSAGRCNRNAEGRGSVNLIKLVDANNGKQYWSYIYDAVLIDATEKLLKVDSLNEREFYSKVREYYTELLTRLSEDESNILRKAMCDLDYDGDKGICTFRLIEEQYRKIDCFIEYDDEAVEVWRKCVEISEIQNRIERRNEYKKIRHEFNPYVISIPAHIDNKPPISSELGIEIGYVTQNRLTEYYDANTGYKTKGETVMW